MDIKEGPDGIGLMWCQPHRRWEWECTCGYANPRLERFCGDCARPRDMAVPFAKIQKAMADWYK